MSIIKIDYNKFDETISCYQRNIELLSQNKQNIENYFKVLQTSWKGNSKDKFFDNIYMNLTKSMQADINHLTFLKNQLEIVRKDFKSVENKYKNLKLK